eukprot:gene8712-9642_t
MSSNKLKTLFQIANGFLDKGQDRCLPKSDNDVDLANNFSDYFHDKVRNLRLSFDNSSCQTISNMAISEQLEQLSMFEPTTAEELLVIIHSHKMSCSSADPLNAALLSKHIDILLPFWVDLVNLSLKSGTMDCLKSAVVVPIPKDVPSKIDSDNYKNYRLVSNLVFVSKLVERCVARRLEIHMENNVLHSRYQFGYRQSHSTELLLLNVTDDILRGFEKS